MSTNEHHYHSNENATGAESVHWNLADLYPSHTHESFIADMEEVAHNANVFHDRWKGRIGLASDDEFMMMIQELEHISDTMGKLGSRVRLEWATDSQNETLSAVMQSVSEQLNTIRRQLIFVSIEVREMSDEHVEFLLSSPLLQRYNHWLKFNRTFRSHTLSEPEEILEAEMDMVGINSWIRFYDQVNASSRYDWDGDKLPIQAVMQKSLSADREQRKKAFMSLSKGFIEHISTSTFVYNMMLTDSKLSDQRRNYPTWVSARNMANKISDESVSALVDSVTSRYGIVHRFQELKRILLGIDKGDFWTWDRNAPVLSSGKVWSWDYARDLVSKAYHEFHPQIGSIVDEFFEKNWIDASVRPGKQSGAFASPTVPSAHPYIFMNYSGSQRDIKTLAHELGHGVHQYLSRRQGYFNAGTPLTIAETASVFGEMLVFDSMLRSTTNDEEKLVLLMEKLNDINNTVFRQIAFNRFEHAIHTARRTEGELTTARINELWLETQIPVLGPDVKYHEDYKYWWSYISHFIHTPGYVYAYAFGELLVLALYEIYKEDDESFKDRYIALLSAGGSQAPEDLLKPFGIDLTDHNFWQRGLNFIENLLVQAEEIASRLEKKSS